MLVIAAAIPLVLHIDLLPFYQSIGGKLFPIQISFVHIHCTDLMIVVGIVIVDSLICITAGSVQGNLIFVFSQLAAASLLVHAANQE